MAGTGGDRNPLYTPLSLPEQQYPEVQNESTSWQVLEEAEITPTLHDPYLDSGYLEVRMNPPHGRYWRSQKSGPNALQGSDLDSGDLGVEKESTSWQALEMTEVRSQCTPRF
jgi:hypothetical protein